MREDKLHRRIKGEQQRFVFHNQLITALCIIFLCLSGFGGIDCSSFFVNGEIPVMYLFRQGGCINIMEQGIVSGLCNQLTIFLFKPLCKFAFAGITVCIIGTIVGDPIDEKQSQDLDSTMAQSQFFLQMFLNRFTDLQTLDGIILRYQFLYHIHIGTIYGHRNRNHLDTHGLGDGKMAVITGAGAQPLYFVQLAPGSAAQGTKQHEAGHGVIHHIQTGVTTDDDVGRGNTD